MIITDVAKDCMDVFRHAKEFVDSLWQEQMRLMCLLAQCDSPPTTHSLVYPSMFRYGAADRTSAVYSCLFCNQPTSLASGSLRHFAFQPAYFSVLCADCHRAAYQ